LPKHSTSVLVSEPTPLYSDGGMDGNLDHPASEGMALNKKDEERVREIFREVLAEGTGWFKAKRFIKEWSGVAVLGAVVLGGLSQYRDNSEFHGRIDERMKSVEGYVREQRAPTSPAAVIEEIGELEQQEFTASLPALQVATAQSFDTARLNESTLHKVADKLAKADAARPGYWPTVFQFIGLASAAISPSIPAGGPTLIFSNLHFGPGTMNLKDKVVLLDGGSVEGGSFENCRIIFTENQVKMRNVVFINCVFEIPITTTPSPYLTNAARQLLASSFSSIQDL